MNLLRHAFGAPPWRRSAEPAAEQVSEDASYEAARESARMEKVSQSMELKLHGHVERRPGRVRHFDGNPPRTDSDYDVLHW